MDRAPRIQQLYGYSVCLIAIVTSLIAISQMTDAAFALADPLRTREYPYGNGMTLVSYESYAAANPEHRIMRSGPSLDGRPVQDTLSLEASRARFDVLQTDHVENVRYTAMRNLVSNGLLLLVALGLFVSHWLWLRRAATMRPA